MTFANRFTNILIFLLWTGVINCYNVPCTFNTMCMCWVQDDDDDFTKMDISCMGVPFARFPGTYKINIFVHYINITSKNK